MKLLFPYLNIILENIDLKKLSNGHLFHFPREKGSKFNEYANVNAPFGCVCQEIPGEVYANRTDWNS